jgi:hypothetical protein
MKLQDYRNDFYAFSGKASDLNRQLAFAAIALIWLFKRDVSGQPTIPAELVLPGILVVLSLTFEMLHYCVASIIWRIFYRAKERENVAETAELVHSVWLERPIWALFVIKIICVIAAYLFIFAFLLHTLLRP